MINSSVVFKKVVAIVVAIVMTNLYAYFAFSMCPLFLFSAQSRDTLPGGGQWSANLFLANLPIEASHVTDVASQVHY